MRLGLEWFAKSASLKDVGREYDIGMPWSLGEFSLVSSCHAVKDKFILQGMTTDLKATTCSI